MSKPNIRITKESLYQYAVITLGALVLALLVYGVYVVRYLYDDSIRTEEDMEKYFGLMPLAVIPEESANRDEDGMKPDGKRSQAKERRKK